MLNLVVKRIRATPKIKFEAIKGTRPLFLKIISGCKCILHYFGLFAFCVACPNKIVEYIFILLGEKF